MFEKIHVKGKKQHPIYKWLSDSRLNGWNDKMPTWNFCKYLIDEKGKLLEYYNMRTAPEDTVITRHLRNNLTRRPTRSIK
jgi:glutathione peroxidase